MTPTYAEEAILKVLLSPATRIELACWINAVP